MRSGGGSSMSPRLLGPNTKLLHLWLRRQFLGPREVAELLPGRTGNHILLLPRLAASLAEPYMRAGSLVAFPTVKPTG